MTSDIVSVEIGRSTWQGPAEEAPQRAGPITMTYRNYRGEIAERRIIPEWVGFGATDWHPEPQWLLRAFDLDKNARRDFALADCQFADLYRSADMAECAAFSAGYEAGERDGRASGQQVRALVANLSVWAGKAHPDQQLVDLAHVLAILDSNPAALTPAPRPSETVAEALSGLMEAYKEIADSGDAGFWKAEETPEYQAAVAALRALKGGAHG